MNDLIEVHFEDVRYLLRQTVRWIRRQPPTGPNLRTSEPTNSRHELLARRYTQTGQSQEDGAFDHVHFRSLVASTTVS